MNWMHHVCMNVAGEESGGAAGTASSADTSTGVSSPAVDAEVTEADARPYLGGDDTPAAGEDSSDAGKAEEKAAAEAEPKEYNENDYLETIKKDVQILGDNAEVQLDEAYIKGMAPVFKECGVSPEQANKLANAFAKLQIDSARDFTKNRIAHFKKMEMESRQKYSKSDFEQINAGIKKCFKPGGMMDYLVRNSEIGAEPEFLALMHQMGAGAKLDGVAGAAAGSGAGTGSADGYEGLSRLW